MEESLNGNWSFICPEESRKKASVLLGGASLSELKEAVQAYEQWLIHCEIDQFKQRIFTEICNGPFANVNSTVDTRLLAYDAICREIASRWTRGELVESGR